MRKIKFITENRAPEEGEMIIFQRRYAFNDSLALEAWESDGPYAMITQCMPDVPLAENEVILNHDIINHGQEFLESFLEYMTCSKRELVFGPFRTKTLIVKLKEDWKERCISADE